MGVSTMDKGMASKLHDPLSINVPLQSAILLASLPKDMSLPFTTIIQQTSYGTIEPKVFLSALSHLLASPSCTMLVVQAFRPLLVDLCARWLEDESTNEVDRLEAMALLIEIHEEIYPILNHFLARPSLKYGPLSSISAENCALVPVDTLQRLLLIYYRLLRAVPDLAERCGWPLHHLALLLRAPHLDTGVRLLALFCYSLQAGMPEVERDKLELEVLGEPGGVDAPVRYEEKPTQELNETEVRWIDGWLLPIFESKRVTEYRESFFQPTTYYNDVSPNSKTIQNSDLNPYVANISNIFLVRSINTPPSSSPLFETSVTSVALQTIALHLSRRLPILLTAPPGSGKALLIQHLSSQLHDPLQKNHALTIYLSDTSLDPKSLFGSYISSPTKPGAFEWVEGALVRAMRAGKWIVLKDIDKASGDVLGTILPLIESLGIMKGIGQRASINISGRQRIEAADSFMLFATRSVTSAISRDGSVVFPPATFLGHHHWAEVRFPAPSTEDQYGILNARFPRLAGEPLQALLSVWDEIRRELKSFSSSSKGAGGGTLRDVGMRDLEKWIQRVNGLLPISFTSSPRTNTEAMTEDHTIATLFPNPTLREDILLEIRDVFLGSLSAPPLLLATKIGALLGLSNERVEWALGSRTPEYEVEKNPSDGRVVAVRFGRTRLVAPRPSSRQFPSSFASSRPFALHRPSLVLLERIAACAHFREPVLLVGETGTGKTTAIQHLSGLLHNHHDSSLVVINLSNQTESADLLGGYKPLDPRVPAAEIQDTFVDLFDSTFSRKKKNNADFVDMLRRAVLAANWKRTVAMWKQAIKRSKDVKMKDEKKEAEASPESADHPHKKRKVVEGEEIVAGSWDAFESRVMEFEAHHVLAKSKFVFTFVEGPLVKAVRAGQWVLLDEINLASPETLESITPLLQSPTSSITLTEQGSLTPIPRHPSFRIFASMNPATDVGKKDLPPNLRSRFTELWVPPPDDDRDALVAIVKGYIGHCALSDRAAILDVAEFYSAVRKLVEERAIADGSNKRPHFSMRTLARALTFAADVTPSFGLRRALWEGCLMGFTMSLDEKSAALVTPLAERYILSGVKDVSALLSQIPSLPPGGGSRDDFVQVGPFWLLRGPEPLQTADEYILTPSVQQKLMDLSRIILTRRFPVLIEGPTSAGKTSAIEYLAKRTGHRFIRINNHEHTDIQEYLGAYVSDPETGKLVFQDGLLVRALRRGDWIVLDELNLAPTDVLEALNRLLDDNRELIIPETQEIVRPHPDFMLFATQNPPGLYAGRKVLSRAFRNRFLEVHFDDVPQVELEVILCERSKIAPSRGAKIVAVFRELQKRRQAGRVFETRHSFATLRDLFRWAGRDWKDKEEIGNQSLAEAGYMLLAERTRRADDKAVVKEVIESVMKVRIDERSMYQLGDPTSLGFPSLPSSGLVWTFALKRLFTLVVHALRNNEPVLLVGETGSGKTSVCELYSRGMGQQLYTLNCHQNTETADLLGGQRPIRNRALRTAELFNSAREIFNTFELLIDPTLFASLDVEALVNHLNFTIAHHPPDSNITSQLQVLRRQLKQLTALFEWHDGPLVNAMKSGGMLLLDEISLADDSVLERLNSVLEPARTLVLAEKGGWDIDAVQVTALESFKLIATMNPGGDYGKKELSPALRNRFTEIWVPQVELREDRLMIISSLWQHNSLVPFSEPLLDFCEWFSTALADASVVGIRDILAWVTFCNTVRSSTTSFPSSVIFHHAAHMTLLDGLASLPQTSTYTTAARQEFVTRAVEQLHRLVPVPMDCDVGSTGSPDSFQIGSYSVKFGPYPSISQGFNLQAPTTHENAMRVLRACQLTKPVLLEGSPGVGKTSLIAALAAATGHRLCRINLSDQTDIMDLFGSDLPVEGGKPGEFVWKDAAFLRALQDGDWVLLDEMNLAPQAVLEGLNAVLDHRGTVDIPELGRSFSRHPSFRIFAAQNPLQQGGGRKGLPKSFLNRFTKVYIEELTPNDLLLVCQHLFPDHSLHELERMITFNTRLHEEVVVKRTIGREGFPWEFNLRDILRWVQLLQSPSHLELQPSPVEYLETIYVHKFRSQLDKKRVRELFAEVFECTLETVYPGLWISPHHIQIGHHLNERASHQVQHQNSRTTTLTGQLPILEALGRAIEMGWLVILTGHSGCGKTALIRHMARLSNIPLHEFGMNSAMDTSDLLGSFEQVDGDGKIRNILSQLQQRIRSLISRASALGAVPTLPLDVGTTTSLSDDSLQDLAAKLMNSNLIEDNEIQQLVSELSLLRPGAETAGRFEWTDGPLITAMKQGQWLVLDHANLCNPSVLDRINSLCESNGRLLLSERGLVDGEVQVLVPHSNFRLIMALDPRNGELSRAMRNRGVELSMANDLSPLDTSALLAASRLSPYPKLTTDSITDVQILQQAQGRGLTASTTQRTPLLRPFDVSDYDSKYHVFIQFLRFLSQPSMTSEPNRAALLEYFVRSTPTIFQNHLRRFLATFSEVGRGGTFFLMEDAIDIIRKLVAIPTSMVFATRGVPLTFLRVQPIDLLLNPNLVLRLDDHTVHPLFTIMLEFFELYAGLNALKESLSIPPPLQSVTIIERSKAISLSRIHAAGVEKGVAELYPLIRAVELSICVILNNPNDLPGDRLPHVFQTANLLMSYVHLMMATACHQRFDYGSIRGIVRRLEELLRVQDVCFKEIEAPLAALSDAVSPTTGHGMDRIWSGILLQSPPTMHSEQLKRLNMISVGDSASGATLRSQVLDFMSILALGRSEGAEESSDITHLTQEFAKSANVAVLHDMALSDSIMAVMSGFQAISRMCIGPSDHVNQANTVIQFGLTIPQYQLKWLVPWRHVTWTFEDVRSENTLFPLLLSWLQSVWHIPQTPHPLPSSGSGVFLTPLMLERAHSEWKWDGRSLKQINDYEESLKRFLVLSKNQCRQRSIERNLQILVMFLEVLSTLVQCYQTSYKPSDYGQAVAAIKAAQENLLSKKDTSQLTPAFRLMHATSDVHLQRVLDTHFAPLFLRPDWTSFTFAGRFAVALSYSLVELYIPDIPIDPVLAQQSHQTFWQEQSQNVESRIHINEQAEILRTGHGSNPTIEVLTSKKASVGQELSRLSVIPVPRKPDLNRVHALFGEVFRFKDAILSWPRVEQLITTLEEVSTVDALAQEKIIQGSISGFLQRLDVAYEDYSDITQPISMALELLRFGIRLITCDGQQRTSCHEETCLVAASLGQFPSVISSAALRSQGINPVIKYTRDNIPAALWVSLMLHAVVRDVQSGVEISFHIPTIKAFYDQLIALWLTDKEHEKKEAEEAASLYRRAKHDQDVLNDAEQEEKEFEELFPSYEEEEETRPTQNIQNHRLGRNVGTSDELLVYQAHSLFFGASPPSIHSHSFQSLCTDILDKLMQQPLKSDMDEMTTAYRVALISDRLHKIVNQVDTTSRASYDFYHSPNVPEARKAVITIQSMKTRLTSLIAEWPDQMILHQLRDRCESILAFDLHSPVAKLLSALEQLHLHTNDWETYANRDNNLKLQQHALAALIVEWRKLELSCWAQLLDVQESRFSEAVSSWWFRLYESVVQGSLSVGLGSKEEVDQHLAQLSPLLDQFVTGSPLGQFRDRLNLLQSFGTLLRMFAANHTPMRVVLDRTATLVESTHSYYEQFSAMVSLRHREQRKTLEVEIRDLIKLASWKDINVQALKASAQRTHHQLHKLIRKHRDILRQPVQPLLTFPVDDRAPESSRLEVVRYEPLEDPTTSLALDSYQEADVGVIAKHLADLPVTFVRLRSLRQELSLSLSNHHLFEPVDQLAVDIITTAKALSLETVATTKGDARDKAIKALTAKKRKALADLLKELKAVGLSPNPNPSILEPQRSRERLMELKAPHLPTSVSNAITGVIGSTEKYHHRINLLLPELRAKLSGHHADVSTREIQRGTAFVESSYAVALQARSFLSQLVDDYSTLQAMVTRFQYFCSMPNSEIGGPWAAKRLAVIFQKLCRFSDALNEIQEGVSNYANSANIVPPPVEFLHELSTLSVNVKATRDKLAHALESASLTAIHLLSQDEVQSLAEAERLLADSLFAIEGWTTKEPVLYHFCHSVVIWLQQDLGHHTSEAEYMAETSRERVPDQALINAILIISQNLSKPVEQNAGDLAYLRNGQQLVQRTSKLLASEVVLPLAHEVVSDLASAANRGGSKLSDSIRRVTPFLEQYACMLHDHLFQLSQWCHATHKLTYVLCSTIQTLAEKGFCKPPDVDDGEQNDGAGAELADGTGLGEGSGSKNVSNEIEDESQVEGLQGEQPEDQSKDEGEDRDDDAIEMDDDFGGELEDADGQGEEDDDDSDKEDQEHDEKVENLDPLDPNAVDEKMWSDERGQDDTNDAKQSESGAPDQNEDAEMTAKEESESKPSTKENAEAEKLDEGSDQKQEEEGEDGEKEDGPDLDEPQLDLGIKLDDRVMEANNLDLPEDLNLDGPENDPTGGSEDDDLSQGEGEDEEKTEVLSEDGGMKDMEDGKGSPEDSDNEGTDRETAQDTHMQDDTSPDEAEEAKQEGENGGAESRSFNPNDAGSQTQGKIDTSGEPAGEETNQQEQDEKDKESAEALDVGQDNNNDGNQDGATGPSTAFVSDMSQKRDLPPDPLSIPNPLRSLGDALKEIRRRYEEISLPSNPEPAAPPPQPQREAETSQLEYLQHEDEADDMQALGPAGHDEATKLRDLKISDEDPTPSSPPPPVWDVEMTEEPAPYPHAQSLPHPNNSQKDDHIDQALTESQIRSGKMARAFADSQDEEMHVEGEPAELASNPEESQPPDEIQVEREMRDWLTSGQDAAGSDHIWRLYESLTHDLSYTLCEQLRLILEPTLATRLKGDYRTGKRLNMKKIIPYIASEFTKDKIWLRRTRPSRREYQVLIALDDSKSMAESHSVHLAYETLALVSKALSRLEVGDVAIARFGKTVEMLHSFDSGPFSDAAGANVMGSFKFNQTSTDVLALMQTSLAVLREARSKRANSSSTAGNLWQLQVIISDGICQSHEQLRAVLRQAEEQKVMIVFVIVDSLNRSSKPGSPETINAAQNSILSMNQVSYKNINGKMELQMERYLDTFPFEYYVVLRDVEALPDVLSGTLKQFFERSSEE